MKTNIKITIISFLILQTISCNQISISTWPNGDIPYIATGFSNEELILLEECMMKYEMVCDVDFFNVLFEEPPTNNSILYILKQEIKAEKEDATAHFSGSSVGYHTNSINYMLLTPVRLNKWVLMHEIAHVLGLEHEHQRIDRDLYIHVNVPDYLKSAFLPKKSDLYDMMKYPYDVKSITHYDSFLGGDMRPFALLSTKDHKLIQNKAELSIFDILKLRDLYPSKNRILEM